MAFFLSGNSAIRHALGQTLGQVRSAAARLGGYGVFWLKALRQPTIDLTILQPAGDGAAQTDPLAGLVVTLAFVWMVGVPWLRLCWWLGHRPSRGRTATGAAPVPRGRVGTPTAVLVA